MSPTLRPSRRPLPTGRQRDRALERARDGLTGPIRVLDRFFGALERLSLGYQLSQGARGRAAGLDSEEAILWRFRAASIVDWYIVAWVVAELAAYLAGLNRVPGWVLVALATYRLVEITQVFANAVLFEQRRSEAGGVGIYTVVSIPRSIVHAVTLLGETILCFGVLIFVGRDRLDSVESGQDALNFSIRTIFGSVGNVHGAFGLLVDAEPVLGLLFAGAVLARLINAIPAFGDIREALRRPRARPQGKAEHD